MNALRPHIAHHRKQMFGCVAGTLLALIGGLLGQLVVAIAGAVICGASCFDMVRMMVVRPKRG